MTDSSASPAGRTTGGRGKGDRLVTAGARLFHEQGIEATTLAAVAAAATVPVGNVYYYFKTKEDLVQAVVQARTETLRAAVASLERDSSPRRRLHQLVDALLGQRELLAQHGCPYGLLGADLARRGDAEAPAALFSELIDWTARQFEALGRPDAHELALELIVAYQGSALVAHIFGDPEILIHEADRLGRWIDNLSGDGRPADRPSATAPAEG